METPKPQLEQKEDERQTKLDDLLGPAPVPASAVATGVTLTEEVAKPLTEGPVVVEPSHEAPVAESPVKVANPPEPHEAAAMAYAVKAVLDQPVVLTEEQRKTLAETGAVTLGIDQVKVEEPAKKKRKRKAKKSKKRYHPLEKPRRPAKHGLFDLKAKAGKTLGVKCIFCKDKLRYKSGRPPIICKKVGCFRKLRNAYRRDYAKAVA